MCRLRESLCLVIAAVLFCSGQVESATGENELTKLLLEVRQLRKAQEDVAVSTMNMSTLVKERLMNLNRRLNDATSYVEKYYQRVYNFFGKLVKAFCPKKQNENDIDQLCPYTSCFKKLPLKESSANSIKVLTNVGGVTSQDGCAILCHQKYKCHAFLYYETQKLCKLLTNYHSHMEPTGPTVTVWLKTQSNLGTCPFKYINGWETSRYRFYKLYVTWEEARLFCHRQKAKLAELTDSSEIRRVASFGMAGEMNYWYVGGQRRLDSEETDSEWRWYASNMKIPTDGFQWNKGRSSYHYGNNYLVAQKNNGKLYFSRQEGLVDGFLCECILFPGQVDSSSTLVHCSSESLT